MPEVVRAANHYFSTRLGIEVDQLPSTGNVDDGTHGVLEYTPKVRGASVDQGEIFRETHGLIKELGDRADERTLFSCVVDQYIKDRPDNHADVHELTLASAVLNKQQIASAVRAALQNVLPADISIVTEILTHNLANKPRPPIIRAAAADGEHQDALWLIVRNAVPVPEGDKKRAFAQIAVFDALVSAYEQQARGR
ncbi:MAG: hypothetical protein JO089_01040 [Alphaproteobacteria bacterium]|nr:hypothetical protein [Alphaproteobacteria bacterium]